MCRHLLKRWITANYLRKTEAFSGFLHTGMTGFDLLQQLWSFAVQPQEQLTGNKAHCE